MSNVTLSKRQKQIEEVLNQISVDLNNSNISWILGASGALMVWGIDIEPQDLDIYVSRKDIEELESIYKKYIVIPLHVERIDDNEYLEFQMNIDGVDVEIAENSFSGSELTMIQFNGDLIPVYPLEKELEHYRQRHDPKNRIPLIEKRLRELERY